MKALILTATALCALAAYMVAEKPEGHSATESEASGPMSDDAPSSGQGVVPVRNNRVLVRVGSNTLWMLIDSGCNGFSITQALGDRLIKHHEATEIAGAPSELAGGHMVYSRHILIRRIVIGGRTVKNVEADLGASEDLPLLGTGVLGRFESFTVTHNALVLK